MSETKLKRHPKAEIWAKKPKEPYGKLYTAKQVLRGEFGKFGNKGERSHYLKEAADDCDADIVPLCCDWCGKPRHDDDCE